VSAKLGCSSSLFRGHSVNPCTLQKKVLPVVVADAGRICWRRLSRKIMSSRLAWAVVAQSLILALERQRQVDFWVQGQSEFQDSQDYTEKPYLGKERKGKERKGEERRGEERRGEERRGEERRGEERRGEERRGEERRGEERRGAERNGTERNGTERKGKERKGKERKGKERKGKERKGKERKGKEESKKGQCAMVGKAWWQKSEAAAHRKLRPWYWCSVQFLLLILFKSRVHGIMWLFLFQLTL
jgi:hypothetical protein